MFVFDWLTINTKCDFRLANRFAQREFFKFFITKDNKVRNDEFAAIPILLTSKFLVLSLTFVSIIICDLFKYHY